MRFNAHDIAGQVPAGMYVSRIQRVREKNSQNGNPMVEIVFEIGHGDLEGGVTRGAQLLIQLYCNDLRHQWVVFGASKRGTIQRFSTWSSDSRVSW